MRGNLRSPMARWRAGCPMAAHDALPAPLRLWLKGAVLPWSAQSARRVWEREVRRSGVEGALRRLAEVEAATLARERGRRGEI
ncbi:MAG: hypothetical protein Q27BPR15_10385 [Rhodobacter sp. CACIA14H1]|nr:MAG: hypothetical protein Q27BPR15_10385 [Rhodobacter sp. CACIA14H1]